MNKLRIIHTIQLILTLIGALVGAADKIKAIGIIPDSITPYWGMFLAAAIGVKPFLLIIMDFLDDGEINNSIK